MGPGKDSVVFGFGLILTQEGGRTGKSSKSCRGWIFCISFSYPWFLGF